MTRFAFLSLICQLVVIASEPLNPLSDAFIEPINQEAKWKAGRNLYPDTPTSYIKQLRIQDSDIKHLPTVKHDTKQNENLPISFDPREKWHYCPSLNEIRDQGTCGCCWAVAVVAALTDRVCIHSKGTKHFHFSAEDLLTCIGNRNDDCTGGYASDAWHDWEKKGLVSGGNYNSHQGCKPYSIPTLPNQNQNKEYCLKGYPKPSCVRYCRNGYKKSYDEDKRRGTNITTFIGEAQIMNELFQFGPISVSFNMYEDFLNYEKGDIYKYRKGNYLKIHTVKLMGWGYENGTKYWLAANSWNTNFGDRGFFKFLRGSNECGIEETGIAGRPTLDEY